MPLKFATEKLKVPRCRHLWYVRWSSATAYSRVWATSAKQNLLDNWGRFS